MAIQKINLGTEPLGEGGDTYRSANTKINENFSNPDHAASKLVGTSSGQIPLVQDIYKVVGGYQSVANRGGTDVDTYEIGTKASIQYAVNEPPASYRAGGVQWLVDTFSVLNSVHSSGAFQMAYGRGGNKAIAFRNQSSGTYTDWVNIYTNANTKKDSNSNLLLESGDTIPSTSVASRLVGTAKGQIPLSEQTLEAFFTTTSLSDQPPSRAINSEGELDISEIRQGAYYFGSGTDYDRVSTPESIPKRGLMTLYALPSATNNSSFQMAYNFGSTRETELHIRAINSGTPKKWAKVYTDINTTIGTNKEIVTSSPVVRVFSDKIEAIHEANDLPLEFIRNGEGDYTLKGTTGLREGQNDWQIIIPKDDHDNQLIAFTLEDNNGEISLKTFKRTFSLETFTFGPDLKTPLDIPEGRWVDLHFNDIPQEELDEPEPVEDKEEEPEVVEEPVEEPK